MSLRVIPLGGLGEVGMNALVLEEGGRRVLVDFGVLFPNDRVPGVEVAVPDRRYLREAGGLDAVLLTHGHEDHVGGLASLLREFPVPVFGTRFTLALVRERLAEHDLRADLREVTPRVPFEAGPFLAEPLRVTHSIPDGCAFAVETGEGTVVHTGDFKIDHAPLDGERLDLARFCELGRAGVSLLLSDSTNSEREGFSVGEAQVARTLERVVREAQGRVFIALFASNIHRVQRLMETAAALGRRAVLLGHGLGRNVRLASEAGIFREPPGVRLDPEQAAGVPPRGLLVLATGAQGEPGSALARLAAGGAASVRVEPGDVVVFSSRSIPGNEMAIADVSNRLARLGARIVEKALDPIHASGHAQADEQRIMLDAVRPRCFVPVHGDVRMMQAHARTAMGMGLSASDVFVLEDGEVLQLESGDARMAQAVPSGRVWLDARGGGEVPAQILAERDQLSDRGVVVAWVAISRETGSPTAGPELSSRGVPHCEPGSELYAEALRGAREALDQLAPEDRTRRGAVEEALQRGVRRAFRRETGARPAVVGVAVLV